ncbi:ankyrin repeat domain-containing protein 17-like [Haliotis cracherodii]|uniref:ankyrin repeat domain-containing protein 17-like n=1 Tax=Haliotis cracherodii TaxID=6455 RepID=UPI0039E929D8
MASTNEDSGHHLVMATSCEQSEGHMATSGEQSEGHIATSGEQSESHMATSGEQSEGHMATSGEQSGGHMSTSREQSKGHMDTSKPQGHLAVSDVDIVSSDEEYLTAEDDSGNSVVSSEEEPGGHLVLAGSAETEEDLELVSQPPVKRLRTGDRPSGGSQVANTLNIITGQAGQGTLGRGTLDLRTDEARNIFLPTEPYKDVKRKLKEFGHVTICGASGEGKTTMALVLGSQYRCKGYEVVFVDNIEKFDLDHCLSSHPRVFLIVDDMFGTVGLSANTSQVKSFLNNLLLHLEQKLSAEKLQSQMHESSDAVGKSRKKVQSQPEFQTKDIRVVFTSKSYNFHDGLAKLQYEGFKLFKGQTVMDLTTQDKYWLSDKEKKTIFERHRKALGDCSMQHIPDYSELEICSNIFGFPLICKLCFEFSSFYKSAKSFFKEPLFYLRLELERLLEERNDRSAILVLMLLCEDKLDLTKLDSEGEDKEMDSLVKTVLQMMSDATRSGMYKAAKGLRGTFFTRGDTVGFAHSSMYDACACALYNISPIFVLKHCSDDFLFERVQGDKVEETKVDDHLHLIYVSENYDDLLTTRFTQSIKQGQFSKSVTHPILKQDATVFKLLKKLHCDRTKHLWFHKKEKGQCFLYWAVLGHNARLITDIEHTTGEEFTQGEISEAMEGCAQSNKVTALKWLFSRSEKDDHQLTLNRLLLVAAESGSSDVLVYLLQEGADINTRDKGMQNIFHLVCKSGMEKTLKVLLTRKPGNNVINSVDVNGRTPVMVAAHTGSEGCFKLLQTISNLNVKDKHGSGIFHLACRGGNTAIVQHVLTPSKINSRGIHGWTAAMQAAVNGHQSVFDLLVSNQADLTLVDTDGDSLLHHACRGGNTAIVQHVLSPSNINNRGMHGWTAVMKAAVNGHQSVFDLLVSNQADPTLMSTSGDSLLHLACQGGNTDIVQHVLSPSNINSRGRHGWTAAMYAAVTGHQCVFDLLVSNQADLTLVDTDGDSLLHLACQGGNTSIVQHVLSPSNINSRGRHGWTAAMYASVTGHQSVFDLLVSNQADLTLVSTSGDSLLHLACQGGNTAIVQHVLTPSNINSRGRHGWTAVMTAAVNGHQSVFDLLVSNQADLTLVSTSGDSLLHLACRGGNTAIVQHVLPPSNINSRDRHGCTPVMMAAVNGHQSVFDLLESNQADLTLVDTDGDSLLHLACRGGNTAIVQHVLSPSNINSRGRHGWTAAMYASVTGHQSVFDLLVSNQADLTLVSTSGDSLLHLACQGGNTAIVQHVLYPSNINSRGMHGWTAVMKAAVNGHQSVFDLLVSNKADLTLVSTSGDSLLHLACRGGNTAIVQHVLSPSNINSRGRHGWTAVMKAAVTGHQSVFDLLVSNKADLTLVSTSGDSLLHLACRGRNTTIVQHALSPSNINSRGSYGWTAVMKAAVNGHPGVFDLLVSNKADLTLVSTSGDSLLHLACRGGNTAIVQHVLSPSNINSRGMHGYTPVMKAAVNGHHSVFDLLVSNQADLTLVDTDGDSLLHLACQGGDTAIVQHVLSPSNINSRGRHGWTAVMTAAVNGHQSVFELLVSNQADLTLVDTDGDSLLHLACQGGDIAIVQHVLSPSNINSRGEYGYTPVMKAAVNGHQSVFDLLVSNQADLTLVDTSGDSLLHHACRGGNNAIVQHVLSPSNINSRGMHGYTPVMKAAVNGHQSVFDLLVSNQADLTLVDTDGDSLLHLACQGGNTAIVQHVLSPSNINSRGMHGYTPVMKAAVNGHQSVFDLIVSNQADLTLVDTDGDSLLHLACQGGDIAFVQHVLSPSNINSTDRHGWTAAMEAAVNGHQIVFDLLVSNQADLTLVDTDGDSLLHLACRGGNTAIVQHVLSPSNINSRGEYGWTAAMTAAVNGHQSVFELLVSNQADLKLMDTDGDSLLHLACQGGNTAIVQHVLTPSNINSRGRHGWTAVMQAAVNGHQSVYDLIVSNQADLTLVDTSGDSLLHLACQGGNTAIVQHVLTPSNINSRGRHGWTAVMQAAVNGHQSVFDLLVSNQADLTLVDTSGDSLLHLACQGGNTAIVQHVLSPSNINSRGSEGYTPVMKAIFYGHQDVVDFLVQHKADLTLLTDSNEDIECVAQMGGHPTLAKYLQTVKHPH